MKFLYIIPIFFLILSQPFSSSLIMTIQTILVSLLLYLNMKNIWMSLTLVLVILGGLLISFVYVSSLMPAEPYTRSFVWVSPVVLIPFLVMIFSKSKNFFGLSFLEFMPINLFDNSIYVGTLLIMGMLIMTLLMVCMNTLQVKSPMRSYS